MVVQPAAGDGGETVKMRNIICREEGSQNIPRESTDSVHGEDVERVVGFHVVLQLRGEIAADGSHNSENDR